MTKTTDLPALLRCSATSVWRPTDSRESTAITRITRLLCAPILAGTLLFVVSACHASRRTPKIEVSLTVDFGEDLGQNFGSLFEAKTEQGRVVMGAGFLGAFNTITRSNRHVLHFFLVPTEETKGISLKRLPRPNSDCGLFLWQHRKKLLAHSIVYGVDNIFRSWDSAGNQWVPQELPESVHVPFGYPYGMHLGNGVLQFGENKVTYEGSSMFELDAQDGTTGLYYYANGYLFFWRYVRFPEEHKSYVHACPWRPSTKNKVDFEASLTLQFDQPAEFPYSYGQHGSTVLVGTNFGSVYAFDGKSWRPIFKNTAGTSFQFYSMLNYYDRILLGHYPSGNLYEFDGQQLRLLPHWPGRPEGVRPYEREAQTMALYRGNLFVGVWPWGEVWRYDQNRSEWDFVGRMFSHPDFSKDVDAPYQKEMIEISGTYNHWGQRIFSMDPFGDSLIVSTSSREGRPYDEKFGFLTEKQWKEYGAVIQLTMEAQLSVQIHWKQRPTRFQFQVFEDEIRIIQDGEVLGVLPASPATISGLSPSDLHFGRGVFGPLRGTISNRSVKARRVHVHAE